MLVLSLSSLVCFVMCPILISPSPFFFLPSPFFPPFFFLSFLPSDINLYKGYITSMPPEVIGGRLFGGLCPSFCPVGFAIWHLFQIQFRVSLYRNYLSCHGIPIIIVYGLLVSRYTNNDEFGVLSVTV